MYVLIIGGGRTASHLGSLLSAQGFEVRLVENRAKALENLHRELPTELIYEGDGTDPQGLESVDIGRGDVGRAEVVAAISREDVDNLVASFLARNRYGVRRIIGRVNNPRYAWLFTPDFGVDVALDQADTTAKLIKR